MPKKSNLGRLTNWNKSNDMEENKEIQKVILSQFEMGNRLFNRVIYVAMATVLITSGIAQMINHYGNKNIFFYLAIVVIVLGMYGIIVGLWLLSSHSGFIPRFVLDHNVVTLRNYLFGNTEKIDLDQIKSVKIGNYELSFTDTKGREKVYPINTHKKSDSKKIREILQRACEPMGISMN